MLEYVRTPRELTFDPALSDQHQKRKFLEDCLRVVLFESFLEQTVDLGVWIVQSISKDLFRLHIDLMHLVSDPFHEVARNKHESIFWNFGISFEESGLICQLFWEDLWFLAHDIVSDGFSSIAQLPFPLGTPSISGLFDGPISDSLQFFNGIPHYEILKNDSVRRFPQSYPHIMF